MKVKVIQKFKDKYNGKMYKVGDIIGVSKQRYEEILKAGKLVEVITEKPEEPSKKTEKAKNTAE